MYQNKSFSPASMVCCCGKHIYLGDYKQFGKKTFLDTLHCNYSIIIIIAVLSIS